MSSEWEARKADPSSRSFPSPAFLRLRLLSCDIYRYRPHNVHIPLPRTHARIASLTRPPSSHT